MCVGSSVWTVAGLGLLISTLVASCSAPTTTRWVELDLRVGMTSAVPLAHASTQVDLVLADDDWWDGANASGGASPDVRGTSVFWLRKGRSGALLTHSARVAGGLQGWRAVVDHDATWIPGTAQGRCDRSLVRIDDTGVKTVCHAVKPWSTPEGAAAVLLVSTRRDGSALALIQEPNTFGQPGGAKMWFGARLDVASEPIRGDEIAVADDVRIIGLQATSWGGALLVARGSPQHQAYELWRIDRSGRRQGVRELSGIGDLPIVLARQGVWTPSAGGDHAVWALPGIEWNDPKTVARVLPWRILAMDAFGNVAEWARIDHATHDRPRCRQCWAIDIPPVSLGTSGSAKVLVVWTEWRPGGSSQLRIGHLDAGGLHRCPTPIAYSIRHEQVRGRLYSADDGTWLAVGWEGHRGRSPSRILFLEDGRCPTEALLAPPPMHQ